ncbi:MAG: M20/M25/M40 family metallo-hydrolase [Dehalococcoidia bacterium]|nr:M20/M25/M40 family metallo-hydrolase [Dehalococcoidia bacterium]
MDYANVLRDLIAIDTSVPPGLNYEKAIDYLEPLFLQVGCTTQKVAIPREHCDGNEARVNLLAHRRSTGKLRLIFYSHIDVVPAAGWPAFVPEVTSDKIHGRGAADMKGAIPALLMALEATRTDVPEYDISVMVTTDEETGQADQISYLGQFLQPLEGAYVHSLDSDFGYVSIAALGAIHMEVRVKGKSVHSGLSHLGENAVEQASLVVNALMKLKKKVTARESKVAAHPSTGLTHMVPRLNMNMIHGGLKVNIVPDECIIAVDRRLIPEENVEDAERELMQTLESVKGVTWEVATIFRIPTVPPFEDPITDKLAGVIGEVTGSTGKYGEMGSGDFGPIVCNEWKAKLYGLGVIRAGCNIHGKGEFVYRKDIEDLATVITRFIAPKSVSNSLLL